MTESQNSQVRTRFAPSPTGFVHIGSLRTALFSYLYARHNNGKHVLRVEDTDQSRFVEGAIENLISVMNDMGIDFDEGYYLNSDKKIEERGEYGPYIQSKRLPIYQKHVQTLLDSKHAYYCFCSETRLDEIRREQIALKKPPMYDRLCRKLADSEVKEKLAEFESKHMRPVVRQAIPESGQTVIHDLIYGDILVDHKILDDQVILKSDGFPTYHLAVVVDDHEMQITHVIRGEEWISSTPKHLLLYQFFGWEPTKFAHLPLITNPDKTKLSKRQGDVSVESYLSKGYLKEALINFVAFLGWNPKTEQEIFSLDELTRDFDLAKVNKASAVFDIERLNWLNSKYIRAKENSELVNLLIPYWKIPEVDLNSFNKEYLEAIVGLEKDRLKTLSEIGERTKFYFQDPDFSTIDSNELVWKKADAEKCTNALTSLKFYLENLPLENFKKDILEKEIRNLITEQGYDTGTLLWPLRYSLTGLKASPGPFELAEVLAFGLGKDAVIKRITLGIEKLKN